MAGDGVDEAESSDAPGSLLRSGAVAWALRVTAATLVLAVGAAHYLARMGGPGEPSEATGPTHWAARWAQGAPDPETTGSIGPARQVRLDPCTLPRR